MTKMANIKKGDTVKVLIGKDKGKTGKVLRVVTETEKIVVEGLNIYKKHQKQTQSQEAGIVEKAMPIHISNVQPINPKTGEPTRFSRKVMEDGTRVRIDKKTGEVVD
jgi:large subunit ribosomal protein L24